VELSLISECKTVAARPKCPKGDKISGAAPKVRSREWRESRGVEWREIAWITWKARCRPTVLYLERLCQAPPLHSLSLSMDISIIVLPTVDMWRATSSARFDKAQVKHSRDSKDSRDCKHGRNASFLYYLYIK
jgi:hypothetical protein